jgi:hypothetical protein
MRSSLINYVNGWNKTIKSSLLIRGIAGQHPAEQMRTQVPQYGYSECRQMDSYALTWEWLSCGRLLYMYGKSLGMQVAP